MARRILWATLAVGTALGTSADLFGSYGQPEDERDEVAVDPRDAMDLVRIGLGEAIERAMRGRDARAVKASLECTRSEHGIAAVYEVDLLMPNHALLEVLISPTSGDVLGTEEETDADEASMFAGVLRHSERSLSELLRAAEEIVKGRAIAIELEPDDGPECDVMFVNSRYLIEVGLETRAGHVIELELVPQWDDEVVESRDEEGTDMDGVAR
ncbi:MAG: PepSY domain-containing protein [Phycisphaerales bacterium]|nr:PepSY domain-containing protein [Phycisphaerales bacterium]